MTRRLNHRPGAVTAKAVEDPRQGWLFPKEELLSHGVIVKNYGDSRFGQDVTPLCIQRTEVDR